MNARQKPIRFFLVLYGAISVPLAWWSTASQTWGALVSWLVAANVTVIPFWGYDKRQSRREGLRVPEKALHVFAFLGASPASFMSMGLFQHKTSKPVFRRLYVLFFFMHVVIIALWVKPGFLL